ncbi:hypothetical protein FEM48_Zijuj04G0047400 [Ziziphus jujuba var. spinosa]|uniref:Pentatricopeptide repeat-containing protein n=1 Tax=Ziziphus jujuba var. spinosa TaxID=714518 RepID=A0A978VHV7_ZIZJJ|nr:hypothetical protein FEM48_Zijuj04G0047400 [Ziziphus jujuba var. spinosa]
MRWPSHTVIASLSCHQLRSFLRACARRSSLDVGKKFHAVLITSGLAASRDTFLCNALLHFYALCGSPPCAYKVFNEIPNSHKDTVDWTTLMSCCARHRMPANGLHLFIEMRREGVIVDDVALICVFNSCARLSNVDGKKEKARSLRHALKKRGIRKVPGMSSIYVDGQVYQFSAGDKSHPETTKIYMMLGEMIQRLRLAGYVPKTDSQVDSNLI